MEIQIRNYAVEDRTVWYRICNVIMTFLQYAFFDVYLGTFWP